LVVNVVTTAVSKLVAATVAPAITAPLGSLTVPEMLAVVPAISLPVGNSTSAKTRNPKHLANLEILITPPSFTSSILFWFRCFRMIAVILPRSPESNNETDCF
jgi:hypothetical protein